MLCCIYVYIIGNQSESFIKDIIWYSSAVHRRAAAATTKHSSSGSKNQQHCRPEIQQPKKPFFFIDKIEAWWLHLKANHVLWNCLYATRLNSFGMSRPAHSTIPAEYGRCVILLKMPTVFLTIILLSVLIHRRRHHPYIGI